MKKTINLLLLLVMFSPSILGQMKIGHVNSQKLLDTLPSRKQAMLELKKFENEGVAELTELKADLEKAYKRYEQNEKSWSPVILEIEQKIRSLVGRYVYGKNNDSLEEVIAELFQWDSQHAVLRWGRRIEERFARPPPPPSVFDRFESAFGFCEDRCG